MSVRGLQNINKAKEKYRANFKNTLISQANKDYQRTDRGRWSTNNASSAYQRTDKGRMSYNNASSAYQRTDKGRMSYNNASSAYQRTDKGRMSYNNASSTYQRTDKGRMSYNNATSTHQRTERGTLSTNRASSAYQRTDKGRMSYNRASSAYQRTDKGRMSYNRASSAYQKTDKGRVKNKETSATHQKTGKGQEKACQYKSRSYKKSRSHNYFKERLDDFDFERHFDAKRKRASERICCHLINPKWRMKFYQSKTEILDARKNIYLPPLPRLGKGKGKRRSSLFKTKKFMKSRSRLDFKLAASIILKHNMDDGMVTEVGKLLFPNLSLKGKSLQFKKSFISTQLVDRLLSVRDLWIRSIYANTYRLTGLAESLLAQYGMDSKDTEDKILGWRCHTKGSKANFPQYSSKDGQSYKFVTQSSKCKTADEDGEKSYHGCDVNCKLASKDEMKRVMDILQELASLDVRRCRRAIQNADKCRNKPEKFENMYRLIVVKRNHPEACYMFKTACPSTLLLLRRLSVHYKGAREIYKMANMMKIADQFLSDLDTAIAVGDIYYILKLLAYKPHVSLKIFAVERSERIINESTMSDVYGSNLVEYYRKCRLLPKEVCVSCLKLIRDDSKYCHTITERMSKPKNPNSHYSKLLRHLQLPDWVNTGNDYVESLIGKKMCNYCFTKMQKDEMPRTSVLNKMNIGKAPEVVSQLTQFERILIRQVAMYQTVFKLDTNAGNMPYNQRMSAVKGFSIHLPVPLQTTLQQLGDGRPGKLIDPNNHILLHGLPNKSRRVWQRLINVDNVFAALQWLVKHNPLYADIILPNNPIDLLPPDPTEGNADSDLEEFLCETPDEPMVDDSSFGCSQFDVREDGDQDKNHDMPAKDTDDGGLTEGDSDIVCLDNPEYLIDNNKDKDPTADIENSLEEYLCESFESQSYSSNSSIGDASYRNKDPTFGLLQNDSLQEFLCRSSQSAQNIQSSASPISESKGGGLASDTLQEKLSFYDLGDIEEDDKFCGLWKEASLIDSTYLPSADTYKNRSLTDIEEKRKCVMANCIVSYSKRILANGLCCQSCGLRIKSTRQKTNIIVRDKSFHFLDLNILSSTYLSMKACLRNSDESVALNICGICKDRKLKPAAPIRKTRKRCSQVDRSQENNQIIFEAGRTIASIKMNSYDILDELCCDTSICDSCYISLDESVPVKANFYYKPKTANINSLKKQTLLARTHSRKIIALKAVSDIVKSKIGLDPGACVKCQKFIGKSPLQVLSTPIGLHSGIVSDHGEGDSSAQNLSNVCEYEEYAACIDNVKEELFVVKTPSSNSATNIDRMKILAVNMTYVRHLVMNLKSVRRDKLHCKDCLSLIKQTKRTYKNILSRKVTHRVPRLENMDRELLYTLCLDSDKRLVDSCTHSQCFHCQTKHESPKNPQEVKGGNGNRTDDEEFTLSDEAMHAEEAPAKPNKDDNGLDGAATKDDIAEDDTADDNTGESDKAKTRHLLEHMTEEDFRNLVEQYTVTGLENIKENPDLLDDLYRLLRLDEDPLDLDDSNLDLLAFPEIFCWGIGGKRGFRPEKGTNVQYEETRMLSSNAASRRHIQYLFHLAGESERRKITRSIFSTIKFVQGLGSVDTNTLLNMIKKKDPMLLKRMTRVLKDVPNTASYWNSQHAKLKAQIGKYGPPTFFLTFSPAEYDWPELIEYLREANQDLPNISELSPSDLMAKDPVLTSTFVHQRFDALLDFILNAKPLGEVTSYFIRHEYQNRGTVHFHTLLWIKDAPIMGKSSDEEIASFIQNHVSCRLPDQLEEPILYENVTKYQAHSCRSYCLRRFKSRKFKNAKKETACRFGFPRPRNKRFTLHDVLSSVIARRSNRMRKRLYDMPRTEEERFINDYNPVLSFLWRGNMDIQFVAENSYAICNYITKYITKSETSNIDFLDFKDLSKSTFQNMSKFAYACLKSREMGAHEAADRLLQNHGQMWRTSESFVWVQTAPFNMRSRVMKNIKVLEGQNADSSEVFYPDVLHDFYPNRPRYEAFDNMSLYDFVSKYDKTAGPSKEGDRYIRIAKEDGTYIRTMHTRSKIPVIYHNEYSVEKQPELFYYSMLCFFKPWRNEADIMGSSESCEKEFFEVIDRYPQLKEMAGKKIDIQKARQDMFNAADEKKGEPDDAAVDSGDDYKYCAGDTVLDQGMEDYEAVNTSSEIRTGDDLIYFIKTLNEDQMRVYRRVTHHIEHMFDHDNDLCTEEACKLEPLLLYVSGFGGTGKSYLIKAIQGYMYVQNNVFKEKAGLILAAPTGLAAANINGQTIHSVLKLPVEHGLTPKYTELRKKSLDQMISVMGNLKTLVIDEISMVSNIMLMYINLRLQEVFGESSFFGGKCVIVFGDLMQLPPVKGQPVFEEVAAKDVQALTGGLGMSLNLWSYFKFDELRINQRQAGTENSSWSGILSRIRIGTQTPADIEVIKSRLIKFPPLNPPSPKQYLALLLLEYEKIEQKDPSVVCLMPLVDMVNEFNNAVMGKKFPHAKQVKAIDNIDGKTKRIKRSAEAAVKKLDKLEDHRNTAGLEKSLLLCEGIRVMLRKNVDVSKGLVNGSVGTILKIYEKDGTSERLTIRFDGLDSDVELFRDIRKIEIFPDAYLHRSQFPLSVAYAITIHKSQGLSLTTVMADLGKRIFECGQIYVALSRCKTLLGLHLINFAPPKITVSQPALTEYKRLGSKPVKEDLGINFSSTRDNLGKRLMFGPERVWYTSKNAKKAQSTIFNDMKTSTKDKDRKRKPPVETKPKASSKSNEPNRCNTENGDQLNRNTNSIQDQINAIVNENCDSRNRYNEFISLDDLGTIFQSVLLPWSTGNLTRGSFLSQSAQEFNPDALNVSNIQDKWLSSSSLLRCVSDMQDMQAMSLNGVSIYNLGPYARTCYLNEQRRVNVSRRHGAADLRYMENYVNCTFGEQRLTRIL